MNRRLTKRHSTLWAWLGPLIMNVILLMVFGRIITTRYKGINALLKQPDNGDVATRNLTA